MKIVSIGEITIDRYLDLGQNLVGGISLNFAVNAKRSGADYVSLVSCVGTDEGGRRVLEKLERENVDASHVKMMEGETARIDIRILENGERIFPEGGYHLNVLSNLRPNASDLAFIQGHDILACQFDMHFQTDPLYQMLMIDLDFDGKRVADFGSWSGDKFDLDSLPSYLHSLDLAFFSGDRDFVTRLRPLSTHFDGLIVVTHGADGSTALVEGSPLYQPAQLVENPVDSTGCGDAYQAACTVSYFQSGDVEQALSRGAAHAATILGHYGATN